MLQNSFLRGAFLVREKHRESLDASYYKVKYARLPSLGLGGRYQRIASGKVPRKLLEPWRRYGRRGQRFPSATPCALR